MEKILNSDRTMSLFGASVTLTTLKSGKLRYPGQRELLGTYRISQYELCTTKIGIWMQLAIGETYGISRIQSGAKTLNTAVKHRRFQCAVVGQAFPESRFGQ
jgi:hypothetical protein